MKKIISMITSIALTLALFPVFSMTGSAELVTENGITFSIDKGIAKVYGVEEDITDLVIHEYIGENKVEKISLPEKEHNFTTITIPASIKTICLYKCTNLTDFYVDEANENYCSADGILYSKDMKTLIFYPPARTNTTFTVPDCVEKIGEQIEFEYTGFSYAVNLKEIILPENLIEIDDCAFAYCTFETIELPKSLIKLGGSTFAFNTNLKEITIPENVESFVEPFFGCDNLETLILLREININLYQSLGEIKDRDYLHLLNEHQTKITVYVPDNRLTLYSEVAEFWQNTASTILPLSEMPYEIISGDVNFDQTLSISDIIMLQKGLANYDCVKMWKAGDMDGNEDVNIFDLIIMKREIIEFKDCNV